jgi:hypothetical protein
MDSLDLFFVEVMFELADEMKKIVEHPKPPGGRESSSVALCSPMNFRWRIVFFQVAYWRRFFRCCLAASNFRSRSAWISQVPINGAVLMGRRNTRSQSTCRSLKTQSLSRALI